MADLNLSKARLATLLNTNDLGFNDDEIEVLSTLIDQFERTKVHIDAPSPVAAIKFRMSEMGLSPRQLEPFVGSRARVSEILTGKRQLSIDMIRSLHEGLGIPYESLISNRLKNKSIEHVSTPTIRRLNAFGFDVDRAEILAFLSSQVQPNSASALYRKTRTQRAASKTDQTALLHWQAEVLKKSESQPLATEFDKSTFGSQILRIIARLSSRSDGPLRARRGLSECGISVAIFPPLPGTFLDGAVMAGRTGNPVIGLTLRHDRIDSFWFTLLHELAHVALHYDQLLDHGLAFVDDMEILSEDQYEREADQLARESLIPASVLSQVHWDEDTTQDEIVAVAVRARVHVAVTAGRWQRDHQNYKKFARLIDRGTVRAMFELS